MDSLYGLYSLYLYSLYLDSLYLYSLYGSVLSFVFKSVLSFQICTRFMDLYSLFFMIRFHPDYTAQIYAVRLEHTSFRKPVLSKLYGLDPCVRSTLF